MLDDVPRDDEEEKLHQLRQAIIAWIELTAEQQNAYITQRKSDNIQKKREKEELLKKQEMEKANEECKGVSNDQDKLVFRLRCCVDMP